MAQRAKSDAILDLLGVGSGEAEAGVFPEVVKLLQKLGPKAWAALDPKSKKALELMTESYPALRKVPVARLPAGVGSGHWRNMDKTPTIEEWAQGTAPMGAEKGLTKTIQRLDPHDIYKLPKPNEYGFVGLDPMDIVGKDTPAHVYKHEAGGHVFSGPLTEWSGTGDKTWLGKATPTKAVKEGFAEGISNASMGTYADAASHWYWPNEFKMAAPRLKDPFNKAGYLGRDVGKAIRGGEVVPQDQIINLLLDIIKRYK